MPVLEGSTPEEWISDYFESLIRHAPAGTFLKPVRLVVDEKTALQCRDPNGRGCATADVMTVYIAPKLLSDFGPHKRGFPSTAERRRQMGVLMHELAHVSLLQHGNQTHSERDADAEAKALWGYEIRYDADDVQTIGPGVSPRPARLDRIDNPSRKQKARRC